MPADHGTPNTGDERAREVEAVAYAIMDRNCDLSDRWPPPVAWREARADAKVAIATLDAERARSPSRDGTVAVEALRAIRTFAGEGPHTRMGEACGIDACVGCLIYATADEALAEFGVSERTERIHEDRV